MLKLKPTLWRTCRAIANETRLRLLWEIFEGGDLPVGEMGRDIGISEQNASIQLRILNSRGLISPRRVGMEVIYQAEANSEVEHVQDLLNALRDCHEKNIPIDRVIRMATAFTHLRRIQIVRVLAESGSRPADLGKKTGIKARALHRHLAKLESRGFIAGRHGMYRLVAPKNSFWKCLLDIALSEDRDVPDENEHLKIAKIISGGQTGADRAALDAAIACGVPHGGWCPKGRLAEDGPISACYRLQETQTESYAERTEANVLEADATLIFSHGSLVEGSGTLLTQELATLHGKPCLHCDLQAVHEPVERIQKWLCGLSPAVVLNVAGSRASGDPEIYEAVYVVMVQLLEKGWWAIQNSNL